jgi:chaperonin cofactor prefoldin
MKESRTLLILLSAGLVCTWAYHLYDKTKYRGGQRQPVAIQDTASATKNIRDSLQTLYNSALSEMDIRLDSTQTNADSLKTQIEINLGEISRLKTEINSILKNGNATRGDFKLAQVKITELNQKMEELKTQNISMEEERKRLTVQLDEINGNIKNMEQTAVKLIEENKALAEKINLASLFVPSELKLSAVATKNDKELETASAKKAEKFVLSFKVQNNVSDYNNAEVIVVIVQPDGKVLSNEVWNSNIFDTKYEGRKNFTVQLKFDYQKGEAKPLLFSLNADTYLKGKYTMQLYQNGFKIGQTVKTLG